MEWVRQLPTWVKGTIALFTAVIGFFVLFLNNVYLSITVSVITVLIVAFFSSLYVAFSKVPSATHSGTYTYRFPALRRLGLAGLLIIPLISVMLITLEQTRDIGAIAFLGTPTPVLNPIEIISEDYQKDTMGYDLIVQNNTDIQQVLTSIGVASQASGFYVCPPSGGIPLLSSGHYVVRFDLAQAETVQKMEPPLTIPPHDVVRFTVALLPPAHLCGDWSGSVAVFVENAFGKRAQTRSQTIDPSSVRALEIINFSPEELIDIVRNSPDAISRAEAINQLSTKYMSGTEVPPSSATSDDETSILYELFSEALQDISPYVRRTAVSGLGYLGNTNVVPQIILLLQNDEDTHVRSAAAYALGKLGDQRAIEPLGLALQNDPINDVRFAAASALGDIGDRQAETYLIDAWTHGSPENVTDVIVLSLVRVQSSQAVQLLISELRNQGNSSVRGEIVRSLLAGEPVYLSQFVPTLVDLLAHDGSEDLRYSIAAYCRLAPTQSELVRALGQSAREDSSLKVRLTAVETLGQIGSSVAIEQLKDIFSSQTGDVKKAAEAALMALGQLP